MSDSKALDALFPGPTRCILTSLFAEPERWWTLTELAGRAGLSPGSLRQHLVHLQSGGLIRQQTDGGRSQFRADAGCPIFAELYAIVKKLTAKPQGGETILIVEDQPATAQITRILLESWGYHVLEAHCAAEALGIFENGSDGIQLLLTDVIMPGMSGPQLADELLRRAPDLRVVFMSGYPADHLAQSDAAFLPKPFNPASLSRMIRKELDRKMKTS